MIQLICLFFPSAISVQIVEFLEKKKFNFKDVLFKWMLFVVCINLVILTLFYVVLDNANYLLNDSSFTNSFAFKYLITSVILSVILPIVYEIIRKNVSVNLEFKDYDDKSKTKRNKNDKK